jgi:Outer membrane protein beta-barrel domain
MDDRGANIDIVFRNGLKDFEVLPPPEVWDNIQPVIKRGQAPLIMLRAAAVFAVVFTMSFLAYRWSREIPADIDNAVTALNEQVAPSVPSTSISKPHYVATKESRQLKNSLNTLTENIPDKVIEPENEKTNSTEVTRFQETNILSLSKAESLHKQILASLNTPRGITYKINESDLQYFPESTTGKSNTTKPDYRWSLSAMASPTYYSGFSSGSDEVSKQLMAEEQSVVSYSGGVAFSYKISKRFSIQSGLFYSSLGQEVDGVNSYGGFQKYNVSKGGPAFEVPTTSGTVYTNNADVFLMSNGTGEKVITSYISDVIDPNKANLQYINNTLTQNFSYLELPVVLRYKIIDKMFGINLIGGLSYNLLVNNTVYTTTDGTKYTVGKTDGLNPVALTSSLGMGMEYNFSKKLSFNVEPTFRYFLNPFSETTNSNIHPYYFGIFSGISYKF